MGTEIGFWEVPIITNLPLGVTLLMGDSLILMVMARTVKLSVTATCVPNLRHQGCRICMQLKQFLHFTTEHDPAYCDALPRLLLLSKRTVLGKILPAKLHPHYTTNMEN